MSKKFSEWKIEEILFDLSLYKDIDIDSSYRTNTREEEVFNSRGAYIEDIEYVFYSEDITSLLNFMSKGQKLYGYCPMCNKELVFDTIPLKLDDKLLENTFFSYQLDYIDEENASSIDYRIRSDYKNRLDLLNKHRIFVKQAICSFDHNHIMDFVFHINISHNQDESIVKLSKIGQSPSYTELNKHKSKKYSKLLKEIDCYSDYVRAVNLFSHDIGIGSFVYLRRIIEKLLLLKYNNHKDDIDIEFDTFNKLSMDKKIGILKDYLPDFLNKNNQIYGILSAGIHNLDEDSCKEYFPVLKTSIDIILHQEGEMIEKKGLEIETKKAISKITPEVREKSKQIILGLAGEGS